MAHQTNGNKSLASKIHKIPPEVDFESSKSPAKSESWKKTKSANAEPRYPHDNIDGIHSCDECRISIILNVCHKLMSIL